MDSDGSDFPDLETAIAAQPDEESRDQPTRTALSHRRTALAHPQGPHPTRKNLELKL